MIKFLRGLFIVFFGRSLSVIDVCMCVVLLSALGTQWGMFFFLIYYCFASVSSENDTADAKEFIRGRS